MDDMASPSWEVLARWLIDWMDAEGMLLLSVCQAEQFRLVVLEAG